MPFPSDHRYPPALPPFLLLQHELAAGQRVDVVPYERGEDRHRELHSFTPWQARVATRLVQSQFDAFVDWYETELEAGARRFDVQVQSLEGVGPQWWAALFAAPFRYTVAAGYRYLVTAELLLLDGPHATRQATTMLARVVGSGGIEAARPATGALAAWMAGDSDAWLIAPVPALAARTDGGGTMAGYAGDAATDPTDDALARIWIGLGASRAGIADSDDALAAQALR